LLNASLTIVQQESKMESTSSTRASSDQDSRDQTDELSPESYPGYENEAVSRWMATRTAEKQAAFLLPHLRAGMELLDCGCGPGTITVGLARRVAPGQCAGIDLDATQVELARSHAASEGVTNLRFEAATIYQLPFADASFDAVYSNTVLGWLDDPLAALREIHRVLRVGGVVGIRSGDMGGNLFVPTNPLIERYWTLFVATIKEAGADPFLGREHRSLLRQAGFVNVVASATYETYGTPEQVRAFGQTAAKMLATESLLKQLIQLGSNPSEIEEMRQAWLAWSEDPNAFCADVRCEAIGWKQ
jgi:ubiquinone/menaquinone biosynthesis C-methylase UbiE